MAERAIRILVALDGSPVSETILAALMPLVRMARVDLMLLRVALQPGEIKECRDYLTRMESALVLHRMRAESVVETGQPAPVILSHLKEGGFDFGAMTTHGRRGVSRMLWGSVAEEVVRHADCPLIINRPDARIGDWNRIVVALDTSPTAEGILDDVGQLARTTGSTLHLVSVAEVLVPGTEMGFAYDPLPPPDPMPYLTGVRVRLKEQGIMAVAESRLGNPALEITRYAGEIGGGLIALMTHGRTGLRRAILGSVAEQVLRTAPCPVLIHPLGRAKEAAESAPAAPAGART
jgi:nucleotide-binding universal stress UspA family protein